LKALDETDGDCDALTNWNQTGLVADPSIPPWYFRVDPSSAPQLLEASVHSVYFHEATGTILKSWVNKANSEIEVIEPVRPVTSGSETPRSATRAELQAALRPEKRYTGKWNYQKYSGRIALKVIEYDAQKGSLVVHLYEPAAASQLKVLKGTIVRNAANPFTLRLSADQESGIRRVPSRIPATVNLLLRGDSRTLELTLDDDRLTGKDSLGVEYDLKATGE
jgi:hypothetical protein